MQVAITIDTSTHPAGIGRAMRELVSHISKIKQPYSIKVINYKRAPVPLDIELEKITSISPKPLIPLSVQIFFQNVFRLPFWLRKNEIDVLHLTTFDPLKGLLILLCPTRCKVIVTAHGFSPLIPGSVKGGYYKLWRFALFLAKHKIDMYIAVSDSVKKTLIRYLQVPEKYIKVVYEAPSDEFGIMARANNPIGSDFILSDELDAELLKIYAEVKKEGISHKLVIFGRKKAYENFEIQETIKDLNLKDDVISLGYISDRGELKQLYNAADLFIHKVEREGFGLTPLEAMKCGCPVITSDIFSLPEVLGDAAMLLNPNNTEEWIKNIIKVLTDKRFREEMINRGSNKSKIFSWEETAKKTLNIYEEYMQVKMKEVNGKEVCKMDIDSLDKKRIDIIYCMIGESRENILSIGCQRDDLLAKKLKEKHNIVTLDITKNADIMTDLNKGIPVKSESWGIVVAGEIIEHLYDTQFVLREINRVLKKDGILILSVPNICSLSNRVRVLLGLLPRSCAKDIHIRDFNLQFMKDHLQKSGFKIISQKGDGSWFRRKYFIPSKLCPASFGEHIIIKAKKARKDNRIYW